MKRALILAGLLLFAGCRLENLAGDNTDQPLGSGAANLPRVVAFTPLNGYILDEDPEQPGIAATLTVDFSDLMEPSGFSPRAVRIFNLTTNTVFTGARVTYNPAARRLYLRSTNWGDASVFMLALAGDSIRNRFGSPLDGNYNGIADGSPYDDFILGLLTNGGNNALLPGTQPPQVMRVRPDSAGYDSLQPHIQVDFTQPMLDSTLKNPDDSPKNITLVRESDGAGLALRLAGLSSSSVAVVPVDLLEQGEMYRVTLASSQIRARYSVGTPDHLRYLDGNRNGAQPAEPDFSWHFRVDSVIPPKVTVADTMARGVYVEFDKLMDTSSFSERTFQVYDDREFVPGVMNKTTWEFNDQLYTRIEFFFLRPTSEFVHVYVKPGVRDLKGNGLDMNDNHIGGEVSDGFEIRLPDEP